MQGMSNRSNLNVDAHLNEDMKVWSSGYKACDSILAAIDDLKQGGTETMEYEKIRLEYVTRK